MIYQRQSPDTVMLNFLPEDERKDLAAFASINPYKYTPRSQDVMGDIEMIAKLKMRAIAASASKKGIVWQKKIFATTCAKEIISDVVDKVFQKLAKKTKNKHAKVLKKQKKVALRKAFDGKIEDAVTKKMNEFLTIMEHKSLSAKKKPLTTKQSYESVVKEMEKKFENFLENFVPQMVKEFFLTKKPSSTFINETINNYKNRFTSNFNTLIIGKRTAFINEKNENVDEMVLSIHHCIKGNNLEQEDYSQVLKKYRQLCDEYIGSTTTFPKYASFNDMEDEFRIFVREMGNRKKRDQTPTGGGGGKETPVIKELGAKIEVHSVFRGKCAEFFDTFAIECVRLQEERRSNNSFEEELIIIKDALKLSAGLELRKIAQEFYSESEIQNINFIQITEEYLENFTENVDNKIRIFRKKLIEGKNREDIFNKVLTKHPLLQGSKDSIMNCYNQLCEIYMGVHTLGEKTSMIYLNYSQMMEAFNTIIEYMEAEFMKENIDDID